MDEIREFKYFGITQCKTGTMEGEIRERTVQQGIVTGLVFVSEHLENVWMHLDQTW